MMPNNASGISPQTTLLIILGASTWPKFPDFEASPSFSQSAQAIKIFFTGENFGLPSQNLLDLFDTEDVPITIVENITAFITSRKEILQNEGGKLENLIFYFVGHGGFDASNDDAYFLAIRAIVKNKEEISALPISTIAKLLDDSASDIRRYIILDSCFAASAFKEFQSAPLQAANKQSIDAFSTAHNSPNTGTGLLCSSAPRRPSKALEGEKYTMFSGALLEALQLGAYNRGDYLSFHDITDITIEILKKKYKDKAVLPQIHDPGQEKGPITNIPLFPNPAKKKIGGHTIITVENFDFSDDTIYAIIFNSEADKGKSFSLEQMPLRYVMEEALERYGGDLIKSEKCSQYKTINVNSVDALTSLENYRVILKYLCQSNIAIFDVTGFEPVVMFLLGIRSVVKRGLTLISVGDEYKLGDFIELPFNIKEVNLISHSNSQVDFGDPINLAGTKIKEGFKELVEYPDYLDLPTYDAVRSNIDIVGFGTRKINENQVLVLCPFNEGYQKRNWKLILRPNLETIIKKRTGQSPEIARTLDMRSPRLVSQTLYEAIRYTPMCIVDWSDWRPNVFFEFGVRLAVSELDPVPIIPNNYLKEVMEKEGYSQHKGFIQAFDPIKYEYNYDSTPFDDVNLRYENMLPDNNSKDSFGFIPPGFTYKEITKWIDWRKELSTNKVYRDLEFSADMISTNRDKGHSPILYSENENLREKADQNALELRLAAWFYIDNRYSPESIKKNPQLLESYQRLGNIVARALVKSSNPDDKKLGVLIRSRSNFNQTEQ